MQVTLNSKRKCYNNCSPNVFFFPLQAEVVPSEKPTHNVPAKQHGMPGKFNKFAGPGSNKQRGNLITIQTVPMEEEKPSPVRNAFLGKKGATKPEFTLLRPQDRWASSGGGSDSDRAGHTKPKGEHAACRPVGILPWHSLATFVTRPCHT